jgi:hypothetical protein
VSKSFLLCADCMIGDGFLVAVYRVLIFAGSHAFSKELQSHVLAMLHEFMLFSSSYYSIADRPESSFPYFQNFELLCALTIFEYKILIVR